MIVDPKTFTPRSCQSNYYRETFFDYVELRPGHFAPLRCCMVDGGSTYDLTFRVYKPGLWLFASSQLEIQQLKPPPIAQVDNVIVNGEPAEHADSATTERPIPPSKTSTAAIADPSSAKPAAADAIVEGIGWKDVRVGMKREDLIKALGPPDNDPSSDVLKWTDKHIDCTFHTGSPVVSEVRFNEGFNGALTNGIKLGCVWRRHAQALRRTGVCNRSAQRGEGV